MTTPWISSIRPTFRFSVEVSVAAVAMLLLKGVSDQRLGAGDDFHDLLGDRGLSLAIELQREVLDDVPGVLRGVAHGGHARAVLGSGGLEQRAVDRDLHVRGDQALEDRVGIGLVLDERVLALIAFLFLARGAAAKALAAFEDRRVLQWKQ